jgi:hypothetical protein
MSVHTDTRTLFLMKTCVAINVYLPLSGIFRCMSRYLGHGSLPYKKQSMDPNITQTNTLRKPPHQTSQI